MPQPRTIFVGALAILALGLTLVAVAAQEAKTTSATTTTCMASSGLAEHDLNQALLSTSKQAAVEELLGESLRALRHLTDLTVPQTAITSQALTFLQLQSRPQFYAGKTAGQVCVRLQTSVSAADLARLRLTTIKGDEVCIAQAIPSGRQHADTMAQLSALYTYAPALSPYPPALLLPLLRQAHLSGGAKGASYCAIASGEVYPIEVQAFLAQPAAPSAAAVPSALPLTFANPIGMAFVLLPAGAFRMGSTGHETDEQPQHTVQLSQPFYLGKFEVTLEQWKAVMGHHRNYFHTQPNLPVDSVSWHDVQQFIHRLNEREGGPPYRLPTEAEWEYAARAGTATAYSFGNEAPQLGKYGWYVVNAGQKTYPVGQLQPNAWGLYDIYGNVWEWVQDFYGPYPAEVVVDPTGPSSGSDRVYRGGSWYSDATLCRSARRIHAPPNTRDQGFLGFRLLRETQ
jgi:formylglycine-generating enzyme required for sulfatase activity